MTRPAAIAALALLGCTAARMRGTSEPTADRGPRRPGLLEAGIARVDVTPPPGPSTFGHGPDARVAEGYWTRLYCRAFVLQTDPSNRVAIVPCDLHSISALLHREVAERVRAIVPTSRLAITATHTHAGPAHYFASSVYGGIASSRLPGFDPRMVEFLASRIAAAIVEAHAHLRPAAARWVRTEAWQLTRNRSLDAYLANATTPDWAPPPGLQLSEEEKAIDPTLRVLQIEAVDPGDRARLLGPMGWLVLYAMHPTVLGSRNRLFGADVFGVASRLLEAELRRVWQRKCGDGASAACADPQRIDPLVALVNTNEGDVSPIWSSGTAAEAVRVGRALAGKAWTTHSAEGSFLASIVLDSRSLEARLPGARFPGASGELALCPEAELGAASGHGASDHPTSFDGLFGAGEDLDAGRDDCQAPKKRMLGALQRMLLGGSAFPSHAALELFRLDETWLAFVPAEMTVQAGASLTRLLRETAGGGEGRPADAVVAGLSNGYLQYVTTRREYEVQRYEGASNLYGAATAEFLESRFLLLARSMIGDPVEPVAGEPRFGESTAFAYEPAPTRARFPRADDFPPVSALEQPRRQRGLCTLPGPAPAAVCFWWSDAAPGRMPPPASRWLALVDARSGEPVRSCNVQPPLPSAFQAVCDPGAVIDDRGLDFQTRVRGAVGDGWVWSTVFRPSGSEWISLPEPAGVRLQAAGGPSVESEPFGREKMPERCPDAAVRFCLGEQEPEPR